MTPQGARSVSDHIDIVFDTPPSPGGCQFIEVENAQGKSMRLGEWIERPDGTWAIRFNPADYVPRAGDAPDVEQSDEAEDRTTPVHLDLGDGHAVVFGGHWHGWLMKRHPDGQFVSVRKLGVAKDPCGPYVELM